MNFVALAIPVFLVLVVIELLVDRYNVKRFDKTSTYSFNDSINSLNLGVLSQLTGLAKKVLQFTVYAVLFPYIALFDLGTDHLAIWIAGFIAYDFCYYWYHRLSHEINGLWASHVVHHQSEEYNLTTALRQTSGGIINFLFYLPLAVLGFEPIVLLAVGSLNLVYQFWVHTQHIDKMPQWFEAIFVTPSHHRVHHGQNLIYLDKNHGGVFIIWDRLFGTFQLELKSEPVFYGVTTPLASWNPIWANLSVYSGLIKDTMRTKKWSDKCKVWIGKTGWRPLDVITEDESVSNDSSKTTFQKFDVTLTLQQKVYVIWQHVSTLVISLVILYQAPNIPIWFNVISMLTVGFGLYSLGCVQEQSKYAKFLEFIKVTLWICFVLLSPYQFIHPLEISIIWGFVSLALLSAAYKISFKSNFKQLFSGN